MYSRNRNEKRDLVFYGRDSSDEYRRTILPGRRPGKVCFAVPEQNGVGVSLGGLAHRRGPLDCVETQIEQAVIESGSCGSG